MTTSGEPLNHALVTALIPLVTPGPAVRTARPGCRGAMAARDGDRELLDVGAHPLGLEAGQLEQVGDQAAEPLALACRGLQVVARFRAGQIVAQQQEFAVRGEQARGMDAASLAKELLLLTKCVRERGQHRNVNQRLIEGRCEGKV